jgi:PEP-CTERM motif
VRLWIDRVLGLTGLAALSLGAATASAVTLVDGNTTVLYSASAGDLGAPSGTLPWFPAPNTFGGTQDLVFATEPDLSGASALGNWLGSPGALNTNWSGPSPVSTAGAAWAVNSELALIYAIDVAESMDLVASFASIDNGIHIWVNGVWMFGARDPEGRAWSNIPLGAIGAGRSYIQILLEDSGGARAYGGPLIQGTAVPEPSALALLLAGFAGLQIRRRR